MTDQALIFYRYVFFTSQQPVVPGLSPFRGFTIILRHTTIGRTLLDE